MKENVFLVFKILIFCIIFFVILKIYLVVNNMQVSQMSFTQENYPTNYISEDSNSFIIKAKKPYQINIVDDFLEIIDNMDILDQVATLKIKEFSSEFDYDEKELRYLSPKVLNKTNDETITINLTREENYGIFEYVYNEEENKKETFSQKEWELYRMIDGDYVYIFLYNEKQDKQKPIVNYKKDQDEYVDKLKISFTTNKEISLNCIKDNKNFSYKKDYPIYIYKGSINIQNKIKQNQINSQDILEQANKDWSYRKCVKTTTKTYELYEYSNYSIFIQDATLIFIPANTNIDNLKLLIKDYENKEQEIQKKNENSLSLNTNIKNENVNQNIQNKYQEQIQEIPQETPQEKAQDQTQLPHISFVY